jgi:hypothetical protein
MGQKEMVSAAMVVVVAVQMFELEVGVELV